MPPKPKPRRYRSGPAIPEAVHAERGWTRLAAVAGVDGRTWRRWVAGRVPMPLAARRAIIAAAFGA